MSLLCVFKLDQGIVGLWVGATIAVAFNTCAYYYLFSKMDIEGLIADAKARQAKDTAPKKVETI